MDKGLAGRSADRPYCIVSIAEQLFDVHPISMERLGLWKASAPLLSSWLSGVRSC